MMNKKFHQKHYRKMIIKSLKIKMIKIYVKILKINKIKILKIMNKLKKNPPKI